MVKSYADILLHNIYDFNLYRNPIQSLHRQSVVKKGPMKELNSALGDALAGFEDFQNHQNDVEVSNSIRQEETLIAGAGPIKLKLKMFGKTSPGKNQ